MEDQTMRDVRQAMAEIKQKRMQPYYDFVKKVHEMRKAQKAYFSARQSGNPGLSAALENAKRLEREVDKMLTFLPQRVEAEQQELF
jgi:type III secretory pathway component EscR